MLLFRAFHIFMIIAAAILVGSGLMLVGAGIIGGNPTFLVEGFILALSAIIPYKQAGKMADRLWFDHGPKEGTVK